MWRLRNTRKERAENIWSKEYIIVEEKKKRGEIFREKNSLPAKKGRRKRRKMPLWV